MYETFFSQSIALDTMVHVYGTSILSKTNFIFILNILKVYTYYYITLSIYLNISKVYISKFIGIKIQTIVT